jgi:hypothetical protein
MWGTDGVVSMPQPVTTTDTESVDMEGFVFTPDGLKINISRSEREDIIASAFRPEGGR